MKNTKLTKDFTSGRISKQLFALMIPFMLSNALQVLYSTIDMIIVGKYVGTAGLSAVAQSSSILNFATMVCLGFANGGQVLIAQALGADKRRETNSIIGTLFTVILAMGLIFSLIILCSKNIVIKVMNIPPESVEMSDSYLIICGLGMIFTAGYNMVSAILRGMGDSK
jgi:Na+-driven multidrug efflux pump